MPHNHMFNVNCVWGYLNLFYLDEIVEWQKKNFNANRYSDPTGMIFQKATDSYGINHLSIDVVDRLKEKFSAYPELIKLVDSLEISDRPHTDFWQQIGQLDLVRGTSFKTLCPEWSDLLS